MCYNVDMKKFEYIIIILLCFTIGCNNKKEKTIEVPPNDFYINYAIDNIVEVYSKTYLSDFILDTNGTILNGDEVIDTTKLGTYRYTVKYEYLNKTYTEETEIIVIDTTSPLTLGSTSKSVKVGYKKNLCDLIFIADNYDKKVKCVIEGDYDLNKVGTYNLIYNISDSSNNLKILNFKLKVINETNPGTSSTPTPIKFKDIITKHKKDNTEIGIDVSKWQGNIDFEKVKDAGATFVIMRIGVQKVLKEKPEIDNYYYQNIVNAKKAGLKVGVYLYSKATSKEEAIEQANWVLNKLDGTDLDLPIVFDWESWSIWNSLNLSLYDINSIADSFLNVIESKGYKGMLYGSKYYLQNIWANNNNYPVWLAHYTTKTDYNNDYYIWQLGDTGKIDGINGYVDINVMYNKKQS